MSTSDLYGELRARAFAIAYRMLGSVSVSDAEDVVQEAFLRVHQTLRKDEPIASPRAYIATLVTRLAIDELRSARARPKHGHHGRRYGMRVLIDHDHLELVRLVGSIRHVAAHASR